jgi:hypothetical protein
MLSGCFKKECERGFETIAIKGFHGSCDGKTNEECIENAAKLRLGEFFAVNLLNLLC